MVPLHPRWQRASVQRRYKVQFRFLHTASQEGVSHVPVKLSKPPAETVSRRWFIVSKRLLSARAARSSTRCSPATRPGASPPTASRLASFASPTWLLRANHQFCPRSAREPEQSGRRKASGLKASPRHEHRPSGSAWSDQSGPQPSRSCLHR